MNSIGYVELPATDLDRAVRFHEALLEVELERVDIDGYQMAVFPSDPVAPGAGCALAVGDSEGNRLALLQRG